MATERSDALSLQAPLEALGVLLPDNNNSMTCSPPSISQMNPTGGGPSRLTQKFPTSPFTLHKIDIIPSLLLLLSRGVELGAVNTNSRSFGRRSLTISRIVTTPTQYSGFMHKDSVLWHPTRHHISEAWIGLQNPSPDWRVTPANQSDDISKDPLRGRWHGFKPNVVWVTYHPEVTSLSCTWSSDKVRQCLGGGFTHGSCLSG